MTEPLSSLRERVPFRQDWAPIALLMFVAAVLAVTDYGRMLDNYIYFYTAFEFPDIAAADPYLRDSFFSHSSLFYPLNLFLKIQEREWLVFTFVVGSVLAGCFLMRKLIIRQFALEPWTATLIVIMLLMVDRKILPNAVPAIITMAPGSPSMFTNILGLLTLYYLFEKKAAAAAVAMLFIYFAAAKGNLLFMPSAILFSIMCRDIGWKKAIYFLVPFAYLLFRALVYTRAVGDPAAIQELMRLNLAAEYQDAVFLSLGVMPNAVFLFVLAATAFLVRPFASHIRFLVWSIVITAAGMWLFSVIYISYLMEIFPVPQLIYIGPIRSMWLVIFLFYLIAMIRIFKAQNLLHHEKAGLLLALFGASPHSLRGSLLGLAIVGLAFLPQILASKVPQTLAAPLKWLNSQKTIWPEGLAAALFIAAWVTVSGHYGFPWDRQALAHTGRWSSEVSGMSASDWKAYTAEQDQGVYPLIAIYKTPNGTYVDSIELVAYARKAAYSEITFAGFTLHPTLEYFSEIKKRSEVRKLIIERINAGQNVGPELTAFLAARNVKVMASSEIADRFLGVTDVVNYGGVQRLSFNVTATDAPKSD